MRVAGRLVWALVVSLLVCAASSAGCARLEGGIDEAGGDAPAETDPDSDLLDDDTDPEIVCPGECRPEPQLPFNSRIHLVWIGLASAVPDCPADVAPLAGFEGYVVSMSGAKGGGREGAQWVRECLISNDSDGCGSGTTCAPIPPEDYRLCLSRENNGPCPQDYYPEHVVAHEQPSALVEGQDVVLCCTQPPPVP